MAPILSFTAAEAWEHLHAGGEEIPVNKSVFFAAFPEVGDLEADPAFMAVWDQLLAIRGEITRVLEAARRDKIIGLALDAEVLVQVEGETAGFLAERWALLQEICIVSSLVQVAGFEGELAGSAMPSDGGSRSQGRGQAGAGRKVRALLDDCHLGGPGERASRALQPVRRSCALPGRLRPGHALSLPDFPGRFPGPGRASSGSSAISPCTNPCR